MRILFAALLILLTNISFANANQVNLITDRSDFHLKPLLSLFEKQTGIKVNAVFMSEGLLARLEQRPGEADVVITNESSILQSAKEKDLLQTYSIDVPKLVNSSFVDSDKKWVALSYRARVIYYHKDRVNPTELSTYEDLANPKWKNRVCIRSGYHNYNLNLFASMMERHGGEYTTQWLKGLKSNLAQRPQGNDRAQVKAINAGICDIALVNTYYMGVMLENTSQREWTNRVGMYFPNQQQEGTTVLLSTAAVTKNATNVENANRLIAFLLSEFAQQWINGTTYEYSALDGVQPSNMVLSFGSEQDLKGNFVQNYVDLQYVSANRIEIIKILDEVKFDQ